MARLGMLDLREQEVVKKFVLAAHVTSLGRSRPLSPLLLFPNPQCRAVAHEFLGCIESNKRDYSACKDLSKAYLQCRMDKVRIEGGRGRGAGGRV